MIESDRDWSEMKRRRDPVATDQLDTKENEERRQKTTEGD